MLSREDAIRLIFSRHGEDSLYITNTGFISRAVYDLYPENKNIFYMQGSMGLSPAIGLGASFNTSRDVVVFTGDASLLMHLGITHTIRDCASKNLYVYVLDNGCHESVGAYDCSKLERRYIGVDEIIKITCDGKLPRVGISCTQNISNLKDFLAQD